MGKYQVKIDNAVSTEIACSRRDIMEMVEVGISSAFQSHHDDTVEAEVQPELIRNTARTADRVDARTWRAMNSCGCPMVKAGRVGIGHGIDAKGPPDAISSFVAGYDTAATGFVKRRGGLRPNGAITFVISD